MLGHRAPCCIPGQPSSVPPAGRGGGTAGRATGGNPLVTVLPHPRCATGDGPGRGGETRGWMKQGEGNREGFIPPRGTGPRGRTARVWVCEPCVVAHEQRASASKFPRRAVQSIPVRARFKRGDKSMSTDTYVTRPPHHPHRQSMHSQTGSPFGIRQERRWNNIISKNETRKKKKN